MDDDEYKYLFNKSSSYYKRRSPSVKTSTFRPALHTSTTNYLKSFDSYGINNTSMHQVSASPRLYPYNDNYSSTMRNTSNLYRYEDETSSYLRPTSPYLNQNSENYYAKKYETKKYRNEDFTYTKPTPKSSYANQYNIINTSTPTYDTNEYSKNDYSSKCPIVTISSDDLKLPFTTTSSNVERSPIVTVSSGPIKKLGMSESKNHTEDDHSTCKRKQIPESSNLHNYEYYNKYDNSVSDGPEYDVGEIIYVGKNFKPFHYLGRSGNSIVVIDSDRVIRYIPQEAVCY